MALKAWESEVGDVSVSKVSIVLSGELDLRFEDVEARVSGFRARRAMARLPWEGCVRIRAMPVPCREFVLVFWIEDWNRRLGTAHSVWASSN